MALPAPLIIVADHPPDEQVRIERIARLVVREGRDSVAIRLGDEQIELPQPLRALLQEAATLLAEGREVAVVPTHALLTTQRAANLLGVSRQYLVRLLDQGVIPFERVGAHRRILYADLLAYQRQQQARRRGALREITRLSEELGHYDQG